jgi:hypothetical protein
MMTKLTFKIQKAKEDGRSPIEIVLGKDKIVAQNTDQVLPTLDKLLKRNKIELESLKDIKLEIDKKAGLTSQRIIKSVIKALRFNL